MLQALPATFAILLVGLFKTRCGGDMAIFEEGRVFVAFPVQRHKHRLVQLGAFFEHGLGSFNTHVFEGRNLGHLFEACQVLHVEQHVFDGGDVTHCVISKNSNAKKKHPERCFLYLFKALRLARAQPRTNRPLSRNRPR